MTEPTKRLPTTEELGGSDPDFTGGLSTEDHLHPERMWQRRAQQAEAKLEKEMANTDLIISEVARMAKVREAAEVEELAKLRAAETALASLRGEVVMLRRAVEKADLFIKRTRSLIETVDRVAEKQGDDEFVWFYTLPSGPWHACLAVARDQSPTGAALTATPTAAALGALCEAALVLTQSYDRWKKRDEGDLPAVWEQLLHRLEGLTAAADAVAAMGKEGA